MNLKKIIKEEIDNHWDWAEGGYSHVNCYEVVKGMRVLVTSNFDGIDINDEVGTIVNIESSGDIIVGFDNNFTSELHDNNGLCPKHNCWWFDCEFVYKDEQDIDYNHEYIILKAIF